VHTVGALQALAIVVAIPVPNRTGRKMTLRWQSTLQSYAAVGNWALQPPQADSAAPRSQQPQALRAVGEGRHCQASMLAST
jgi:hypothetical protein